MKKSAFLLIIPFCLLLNSCLRKYDVAKFEIQSLSLSAASTATNNGMPVATNNPVPRKLFALEIQFEISDNLGSITYDSHESSIDNTNNIDSLRIWSNQPFSGTPAGTPVNEHFYALFDHYENAFRIQTGKPISIIRRNNTIPYYSKAYFICDSEPAAGNYKFYTEFYFENGTTMKDSTALIVIE
ncbi:hypothetical protein [Fluviicola sp.]|uniref:hypothetical protein n=1 Tax=Fluviicola sp. TaxID=1917219 RepID=UPI002601A59D|nr:hypothetical protein [Fluviicola sp.]